MTLFDTICTLIDHFVALDIQQDLQPIGGVGDKIFPPTYLGPRNTKQYVTDQRLIDGVLETTVLLDSVASQANRMEEALQHLVDAKKCALPLLETYIDIPFAPRITSLTAPHRGLDAYFLDSVRMDPVTGTPGQSFVDDPLGAALIVSTPSNATALFQYVPTMLVFGAWASHAKSTGIHNLDGRFTRIIRSEILGWGQATPGQSVSSKQDPLSLSKDIQLYAMNKPDERWSFTPPSSKTSSKKANSGQKASELGLGAIPPTINTLGGYSMQSIRQHAQITLLGLRRLHFPVPGKSDDQQHAIDQAARTVLLLLALIALRAQMDEGYDLRSGCALLPTRSPVVTQIGRTASEHTAWELPLLTDLLTAFSEAVAFAVNQGLPWTPEHFTYRVQERVRLLFNQSRSIDDTSSEDFQ